MESKINKKNEITFDLDITVSPEELKPYFDKVYREAQKNVQLKGYRKGHVPIGLIKSMHGKALEQEATDDIVQEFFEKAATEHRYMPIGQPSVNHLHRTESGGLHFTVEFEIMPEITLGDYKGLSARKMFHTITEEEVDIEIAAVRERMGTMVEATTVESEKSGVTLDLQKMVDGLPVIGNVMKDVRLYLGNPEVNPELKASLIGKSVQDTFMIDLETGDNGESYTYEVTVTDVKTLQIPEVDDDFAAKAMGRETASLEELRDAARQAINYDFERRYASYSRDQLIDALLERHPFTPPTHIVQNVLTSFVDEMRTGKEKKLPKDFDVAKFVTESTPNAIRVARWAILRDMIIDKEEITAEEDDFEGLASIEAERTGIDYERILAYMKSTELYSDRIRAEKALQLLEDYAVIQEVEDKEILAEQEAQAAAIQAAIDAAGAELAEAEATESGDENDDAVVDIVASDEQQNDADDRHSGS